MLYQMELKPNAEKLHSSCAVLDGDDPKLLDWIERTTFVDSITLP